MSKFKFLPNEHQKFNACVAENPGCYAECHDDALIVLTGEHMPEEPVPQVVSAAQMFDALDDLGLLVSVKQFAESNAKLDIWLNKAQDFDREHPKTVYAIAEMGFTPEQVAAVWRLAASK